MRIGIFFLLLASVWKVQAQTDDIAMGAARPAAPLPTPVQVNASDGVYDKFVLIRWEPGDSGGEYRLFRANAASGASMQELTKTWQKSTWFCDYSAEKGREYFYAVMASDGRLSSLLSRFDKGFLKKDDKVAQEESLSSVAPDKYAAARQIFALVAEVTPDSTAYAAGSIALLRVGLENIFDEPTPRTDIRVYLSSDAGWDFDDTLLLSKSYSGFPASMKVSLEEKTPLPQELLPGEYYLLVIAAPEGNILNAKTAAVKITVYTP